MKFLCYIADLYIEVVYRYEYTLKVFKNYITHAKRMPDFTVEVTQDMIDYELSLAGNVPPAYVENTAIFRYISNMLMKNYNGLLFHSSAISYNGNAYLFTAKSGTGKSTHTKLLCEYTNGAVKHINDDKPFVRYIREDGKFYVYGNPWQGKHGLGDNVKVPLKAVCLLNRGEVNNIEKINALDCIYEIMKQTVKPTDEDGVNSLMNTLSLLVSSVDFYKLYCNISDDAPKTSFEGMISLGE